MTWPWWVHVTSDLEVFTECCMLPQVLKAVLQLARNHEVSIDSGYAALVIGMCIIVGFATSLDPQLNLLDAATPAFFIHNVCGSVVGRLYT